MSSLCRSLTIRNITVVVILCVGRLNSFVQTPNEPTSRNPDDSVMNMAHWRHLNGKGKVVLLWETPGSVPLSITNTKYIAVRSKPKQHGEKPASNLLKCNTFNIVFNDSLFFQFRNMRFVRTAQLREKLSLLGGLGCLLQVSLTACYEMYQLLTNIADVFVNISQKTSRNL